MGGNERRGAVVGVALVAFFVAASMGAAAAGQTDVRLEPSDATVDAGGTVTYEVVVGSASGGVGSYDLEVSVEETGIANITDAEALGGGEFADAPVSDDNSTVVITASGADTADTGSVTVATVTVRGVDAGETRLPLVVTALSDEAGSEYDVDGTAGATLTVRGSESDDAPEITDYEVGVDGRRITVAFESDENLADIEVAVRGPEDATLTREDFSGDRFEGFEASYLPDAPGEYTVELVSAEDAGNDDGAAGESFSETVTVGAEDTETADDGTATPTDDGGSGTPADETPTPTDEPDGADETPTDEPGGAEPTADDETAETATDGDGVGFGVPAALAAMGGAAYSLRRRGGTP